MPMTKEEENELNAKVQASLTKSRNFSSNCKDVEVNAEKLFRLGASLYETGSTILAEKLYTISDNLLHSIEEIRNYDRQITNERYQDAMQSSNNMIRAALAVCSK